MLTLLLKKDIARARALSHDLDLHRAQLRYAAALGREQYPGSLSSPKGLLVCFGAGCLLALYARHSEGAQALAKPLMKMAMK